VNPDPDPPSPILRPARNGDAPAVRALVFGVLAEYGLRPDPAGADADLFDLAASYERAGGWFAVLVDPTGTVIGSVGLLPPGDGTVELRKMYLDARYRGRGLGSLLLRSALEEARRRGFRRMTLETASVLREAIRLYEAHGFRRRPGAPHVCRCDLVMERELD
jgi:putative acetyltransferase